MKRVDRSFTMQQKMIKDMREMLLRIHKKPKKVNKKKLTWTDFLKKNGRTS